MSVPGNVTGCRVDRIRSGVRDLLQRADHQHSFPSINPIAISIWRARDTRLSRTLDAPLTAHDRARTTSTSEDSTAQAAGSTRTGFGSGRP